MGGRREGNSKSADGPASVKNRRELEAEKWHYPGNLQRAHEITFKHNFLDILSYFWKLIAVTNARL